MCDAFTRPDENENDVTGLDVPQLLLLGIATSIDALAVGISFAFLSVSILSVSIVEAVLVIGATTTAASFIGVLPGHRAGVGFRRPAEAAGGIILILVGTRILVEHLGIWA